MDRVKDKLGDETAKKIVEVIGGAVLIAAGLFCWCRGWDHPGTLMILLGVIAII